MSDGRLFIRCTICGSSLKLASTYYDPEMTVDKVPPPEAIAAFLHLHLGEHMGFGWAPTDGGSRFVVTDETTPQEDHV